MGYNVSDANSYLVITGGGIEDVKICKKAWVWSWFTIGPDDNLEALRKYAKILTGKGAGSRKEAAATGRNHVQDIVKGIIEGETRVIVSGMTMEEIFKERQVFKTKVIENVQSELNQFGLRM